MPLYQSSNFFWPLLNHPRSGTMLFDIVISSTIFAGIASIYALNISSLLDIIFVALLLSSDIFSSVILNDPSISLNTSISRAWFEIATPCLVLFIISNKWSNHNTICCIFNDLTVMMFQWPNHYTHTFYKMSLITFYDPKLSSGCNLGKNLSKREDNDQLVKCQDIRLYLQLYISIDYKKYKGIFNETIWY